MPRPPLARFRPLGAFDRARCKRGLEGDAAAQADDEQPLRTGMQQDRQHAEQALREHIRRIRRIDLSVHRQRAAAREPTNAHRGRRAFAVVFERPGVQPGLEFVRSKLLPYL